MSGDRGVGCPADSWSEGDGLVDAFFDREMDEASRARLRERAAGDPRLALELNETAGVVRGLRAPVRSPDLADAILDDVAHRRRFLRRRERARVRRTRLAVAASVLVAFGGVAMVHRLVPDAVRVGPEPVGVSTLAQAFEADHARGRERLAGAAREVGGLTEGLSESLFGAGGLGLRPGDTDAVLALGDVSIDGGSLAGTDAEVGSSAWLAGLPLTPPSAFGASAVWADARTLIEDPLAATHLRVPLWSDEPELVLDAGTVELMGRAPRIELPALLTTDDGSVAENGQR
jgi:hypothetical protein